MEPKLLLTPTDFIAIINQTLEFALPYVYIQGELSSFRISKNKWVYFDLKDDISKINCFATVYTLPGPLEDGMMVTISGQPRMHPQFGFSMNVQNISPTGEGSIKKALDLLKARLTSEGLFDDSRKQQLPYPPKKIALITSVDSAAYSDFIKISSARWPFLNIDIYNVPVQGEAAPLAIIKAIESANDCLENEVIVITRGGGSQDDLSVYNDERLIRAVAKSKVATLAAIGHERDQLLVELVADQRASTPSNAAELLLPDKTDEINSLNNLINNLSNTCRIIIEHEQKLTFMNLEYIKKIINKSMLDYSQELNHYLKIIDAYNPLNIMQRGFAIIKHSGKTVKSAKWLNESDEIKIYFADGLVDADVKRVKLNKR
jgi:exodeoxyribonuclease VII large subunit